ncbi:MAG: lamin tail domain-containing protein [Candidatus Liptonbacteria bacterium]|nr:lamin tail domain-containing protein [Candidatus Liptonbacteria bacterium]
MYDVPTSIGADDTREWVEITNIGSSIVDLTGWKFNDGSNHTLNPPPANGGTGSLVLPAGGVAILAADAATFLLNLYPSFSGTVIDTVMSLNNTGATLTLINAAGSVEGSGVTYAKAMGAAGDGNTLQWGGSTFMAAAPTPGTYTGASSSADDSDDSTPSPDSSSDTITTVASSSGGGPTEYLPIPALRIITNGDRTVSSGADIAFTAAVYDGKGNKRDDAMVTWSFGDGMRRTGASVFHKYYDPGEYLAVVRATTSDGGDARRDIVITVKNAGIKIVSVSSRGITLANSDSRTLDLSLWRLSMGGQEFRIPADTQILQRSFPFASHSAADRGFGDPSLSERRGGGRISGCRTRFPGGNISATSIAFRELYKSIGGRTDDKRGNGHSNT